MPVVAGCAEGRHHFNFFIYWFWVSSVCEKGSIQTPFSFNVIDLFDVVYILL